MAAETPQPAAPARYRLSPRVALRPEPFGALAYHFGNRRLTFLKTPALVALVRALDGSRDVEGAMDVAGVPAGERAAHARAVASLVEREVLECA